MRGTGTSSPSSGVKRSSRANAAHRATQAKTARRLGVRRASADGTPQQRPVDLARGEAAVAGRAEQPAAVGDDLAAKDRGQGPAGNPPAFPRTVIAHVKVLAAERLID